MKFVNLWILLNGDWQMNMNTNKIGMEKRWHDQHKHTY